MSLYHSVEIGSLHLDGNAFLAPMAGYTDKVYRDICLSLGADLCYTEMVSCEGVYRNGDKTIALMDRGKEEKNLAIQLFAPDWQTAEKSIKKVLEYKPALIDFNCGCPVPKVTKTGAGSALLKDPNQIGLIVKAIKNSTDVPFTVKIRTGWDCNSINYLETAETAFSNGADALCMHARTKSQLYMPTADWSCLKDLKQHFPEKTIIGSGDLFTASDAIKMIESTQVDAVAFARGAIGNPFIFSQFKALANGETPAKISTEEKTKLIMTHLTGLVQMLGENTACREMRKHVCAYLKGIPGSAKTRNAVSRALTVDDYSIALRQLEELKP